MIIIKTEANEEGIIRISGGYTDIPWKSSGDWKAGSGNSFLYFLRDDLKFIKLSCINKKKEVHHSKSRLCVFGN